MKSSLFRFFTSSICFKYWTTLECLMLNSWAASHVVIKGSASMISLNWSLSPSGDWLLIFKVLVSFATTLKPPLHYTFVSSFWAKCVVDVVSCPTVSSANSWDAPKTATPPATIGLHQRPNSAWQHPTACLTTTTSKVEWIRLWSFASSTIFI